MTSSIEATSSANKVTVDDLGSEEAFLAAIDETIKYFNDGDIVEGTVVKVDRDEVLLDIGYKTEGVIPSRELSIKHDVDPAEVVTVGDHIEALVLQKEDKEGRLILSKKRAQYERAWGTIEKIKEEDGVVRGSVIEVVKGGLILDIGLRGFLPASLVEMRRVRDLQPYVGRGEECFLRAEIVDCDLVGARGGLDAARHVDSCSERMVSWCLSRSTELPPEAARAKRDDQPESSLINAVDHAETDDHGTCSLPRHTIRDCPY